MHYLLIGGSKGIGLKTGELLEKQGHQITVASRSKGHIHPNWGHVPFDATKDSLPMDELPSQLDGICYFPGSINLKPFSSLSAEDYQKDLEINFLPIPRIIGQVLPLLKKGKNPSIILFSTVAVQRGMAFHCSISAAKGAVEGFTRSLSAELAPNIRVNAIAPSLIETDLAEKLLSNEARKKAAIERHPLKRFGQPEDIAEMACFLLGEKASWITGQIFHIDGGLSSI